MPKLPEEIVKCNTRKEMVANVAEKILMGEAAEVAVKSLKGEITRFRLKDPVPSGR